MQSLPPAYWGHTARFDSLESQSTLYSLLNHNLQHWVLLYFHSVAFLGKFSRSRRNWGHIALSDSIEAHDQTKLLPRNCSKCKDLVFCETENKIFKPPFIGLFFKIKALSIFFSSESNYIVPVTKWKMPYQIFSSS